MSFKVAAIVALCVHVGAQGLGAVLRNSVNETIGQINGGNMTTKRNFLMSPQYHNDTVKVATDPKGRKLSHSPLSEEQFEFFITNNTRTSVTVQPKVDVLGRNVPTGTAPAAMMGNSSDGSQLEGRQTNCNACLTTEYYWDFWIDLLSMDAYNCVLGGADCADEDVWFVAGLNGWGPECIAGSSYDPNNGIGYDLCQENLYVGNDPIGSEWVYVAFCDNTPNGPYYLNYAGGQSAAYCVATEAADEGETCVDAIEFDVSWTVESLLDCQGLGASDEEVMQVNYYWDQQQTDYAASIAITWGGLGDCFEYNIPGAGSFNIANCYAEDSCQCLLSTGDWCGEGNNAYIESYRWGDAQGTETAWTIYEPNYITCWINYPS